MRGTKLPTMPYIKTEWEFGVEREEWTTLDVPEEW